MDAITYKLMKENKRLLITTGMYINEVFGHKLNDYVEKLKIKKWGSTKVISLIKNLPINFKKEYGGIVVLKSDITKYMRFKINFIEQTNSSPLVELNSELVDYNNVIIDNFNIKRGMSQNNLYINPNSEIFNCPSIVFQFGNNDLFIDYGFNFYIPSAQLNANEVAESLNKNIERLINQINDTNDLIIRLYEADIN